MAEQSVRHTLMVTALMQCASETLNTGEDASGAATRCIEMFRRMFPDITPDELRSALAGAERRRSELDAPLRVEGRPQSASDENTISDRVPQKQPIPELTAARRSGLSRSILRRANRSSDLLLVAFLPFQSAMAEQFFEMLIFPPIPLLHVIFTVLCKMTELITSGRLLIKPVLMRLSRQRVYAVFALIDRGIRTRARLLAYTGKRTRSQAFTGGAGRVPSGSFSKMRNITGRLLRVE